MRAEDNPLDLNNFPDDFCSKDVKQVVEGSSSLAGGEAGSGGGYRKKKGGRGKEGKEERGKVYECRFCSLKFCKSQALGGHMNRHRQERETETLNRARQLVFGNDALPPPPPPPPPHHHLGAYHPGSHMSDPILAFRSPSSSLYTPPGRLFSGSSSASSSSAFIQPYLYQSPPRQPAPYPSSSQFNTSHDFSLGSQGLNKPNQSMGLHGTTHRVGSSESSANYNCIGAPVWEVGGGGPYQKEGLIWGRRMEPQGHNQNHHHGHRNTSSAINRFQDGL